MIDDSKGPVRDTNSVFSINSIVTAMADMIEADDCVLRCPDNHVSCLLEARVRLSLSFRTGPSFLESL